MKVFGDSKADTELKGKYILLDNDFLNQLFKDREVLQEFLKRFRTSFFLIDPLTKFEFLRDIHNIQQRKLREEFISQEIFYVTNSGHSQVFLQLQKNALLLSQIYSHQHQSHKPSFIDLMLAALTMYQSQTTVLMTGNKKDFPRCIFDTVTVFNVEQEGDSSMHAYSVVSFNQNKFSRCSKMLETNKYIPEVMDGEKLKDIDDDIPF